MSVKQTKTKKNSMRGVVERLIQHKVKPSIQDHAHTSTGSNEVFQPLPSFDCANFQPLNNW